MTVQHAGFKRLSNGELLRRAARQGFQVPLTADRNLPEQQNIPAAEIAIVLVRGSKTADIEAQAEAVNTAIDDARPGTVIRVPTG